jgi:peptidoglycan/LPS O-acetylase OafA/YrhL
VAVALPLCAIASISQIDQFVDAVRITFAMKIATAAVIVAAFACFAVLRRLQSVHWPARIALVGALTYPLYLTHNVGKAIFLQRITGGPLWVRTLIAIAFSLALAWIVMWTAKRWIAPALRWMLDLIGLRGKPVAKSAALEAAK